MKNDAIETHPIQTECCQRGGVAPKAVTTAAYEVYCEVYGAQKELVTGSCRGGMGTGEMIAFLYARSFPRSEWRARVDEAFDGMRLGR